MVIYYKFGLIVLNKPEEYSIFLDQIPSWSEYLAIIYGFVVIGYLLLYIRNSEKIKVFSPSEIQPQLRWFKIILVVQFFSTLLWMASEIEVVHRYCKNLRDRIGRYLAKNTEDYLKSK